MAMVCPQCQGSFEQRLQCPTCGVRLEYAQAGRPVGGSGNFGRGSGWQETPWGRIVIGLLLAQGLYYGLLQLCKGGLLAVDEEAGQTFWGTLAGLLVMQGLQVFGLLVGGALAGAGKRHGVLFGGIVGVWNGVIFLLLNHSSAELLPIALYGQPVLQTAFGALGGLLGCLVWRPLPSLTAPTTLRNRRPAPSSGRGASPFAGPVAWGRVLAGAAVAAGGSAWATAILDLILDNSHHKLTVDSNLQAHLVTWEITALALIVGSGLAGATTANGLKQGLCVGFASAGLLLALHFGFGPVQWSGQVLTATSSLVLCLVGGWFGGQLFPPVVNFSRRPAVSPAM